MSIAPELLRRIVEGALLAAAQPLSEDKLLSLIDEGERPEKAELKQVLEAIAASCTDRGFELRQVASGWRFQVPEDLAPWINKMWEEKPQKYSRATLETLAIIAYRQPITRGDIEEIRGVAVSSHIVKSLSERGWIKVVGQRDVPGKPSLYATTREFLDYFNLKSLEDLPTLAEIRDIDSLNAALDLGDASASDEATGDQQEVGDGAAQVAEGELPAETTDAEAQQDDAHETAVAAEPESEESEADAAGETEVDAPEDTAADIPADMPLEEVELETVAEENAAESQVEDYPEAEQVLEPESELESHEEFELETATNADEATPVADGQEFNTPENHKA